MERYKNYIRITTKEEQKALKFVLHPDKKYIEASLAHDLFVQYGNSTCYETEKFSCVINFTSADSVMQAYNKSIKSAPLTSVEENLEFFTQPFIDYSTDGVLHHGHFMDAVIDFFDSLSMYY